MADKVIINRSTLTNIADAIRVKTGDYSTIAPSSMAEKIRNIPQEGGEADYSSEDGLISGTNSEYMNPRVTEVGEYVFYKNTTLQRISLSSAEEIGRNAMDECSSLTVLDLPQAKIIYDYACRGTAISSITLPNIEDIKQQGFANCTSLTKVDLGSKIKNLRTKSFSGCSNLTVVIIRNENETVSLGSVSVFENCPNAIYYVPDSKVSSYKSASNWVNYESRIKPLSELEG